jgi:hypothetical protein
LGEWSVSRPGHFNPGERTSGTHRIGGWLGLKAGLDDMEKKKILPLTVAQKFTRDENVLSLDITSYMRYKL